MKKFLVLFIFQFAILLPGTARDWCFGTKQFSAGGNTYKVRKFLDVLYLIQRCDNELYSCFPYFWANGRTAPLSYDLIKHKPKESAAIMANVLRKAFSDDELYFYCNKLSGYISLEVYFCPESKKPKEIDFYLYRSVDMIEPEKLALLESLILSQEFVFKWAIGITNYACMRFYLFTRDDAAIDGVYIPGMEWDHE